MVRRPPPFFPVGAEEGGVVRSDIDTLTIQSITLAYLRDTKDYYQPVYAVKTDKGILYTLATQ